MATERPQGEQEPQPNSRYIAPLNSLGSDQYELRRPINVLIEDYGDTVTARLPEFGLYTTDGVSDESALNELVGEVIDLYQDLQSMPDEELGPIVARWKRGLSQLIMETPVEVARTITEPPTEDKPYKVPLSKLVEGLTLSEPRKKGEPTLTPELAAHFNQVFGSELPDNVDLLTLIIPLSSYLRHLPEGEREKALALDPQVKGSYNHGLDFLSRAKCLTVGDLRRLTSVDLSNFYLIGDKTFPFFQQAFKEKPQAEA